MDNQQQPSDWFEQQEKEFTDKCGPIILLLSKKRKLKQKLSRDEIKMENRMRDLMQFFHMESITVSYNDGVADRTITYSIAKK